MEEIAKWVFTAGIYGGVKYAEQQAAQEAAKSGAGRAGATASLGEGGFEYRPGDLSKVRTPQYVPPPSAIRPSSGSCCCERYEFRDGLLLNREDGRMWRYDEDADELISIPSSGDSRSVDPLKLDLRTLMALLEAAKLRELLEKQRQSNQFKPTQSATSSSVLPKKRKAKKTGGRR
ncbi:hypothetical protein [Lysobacter sp. GCM10012299]|uniref:hypothetical protein n=1 Tax=Lysobacter sp. GCM10012299 TaxID=3317333 RepID=UPI003618C4A4